MPYSNSPQLLARHHDRRRSRERVGDVSAVVVECADEDDQAAPAGLADALLNVET